MNSQAISFLLPFLLGSSLTLAIVLILLGWRGRVLGGEPRCRRCQYNLIGVTSAVCPECGQDLLSENVQAGARRRRPVMIALGALLLAPTLIGAAGLLYVARARVKLEPHLPASWLISSAAAGSDDAFNELLIRINDNTLSDAALRQLAEAALVKHGQSPAPSRWAEWCDTLAKMEQRKLLTPAQAEQFCTQLFIFELKARSPIRQGDPVLYAVHYKNRTSEVLPYRYLFEVTRATLGDAEGASADGGVQKRYGLSTDTSWRGRDPDRLYESGMGETLSVETAIGKQPLRIACRVVLEPEDAPFGGSNRDVARKSREIQIAAEIEVLSKDAPDPVEWVSSPELDSQVRAAFSGGANAAIDRIVGGPGDFGEGGSYRIEVDPFRRSMRGGPLPVACTFEIIVVLDDGTEHHAGSAICNAGRSRTYFGGEHIRSPEPSTVDVILRSDKAIARETMDVFKIWQGEIRIDDVKVKDPSDEE